jgi:uncharacterized DUF497 family protein
MQTFASPHCITKQGLMTTVPVNRIQIAKRRSSRIGLNARIGLSGQDREKRTFTMPARATNLNKHGAAIQLNRELLVGSTVVVQNSRHTQASARVVAQVSAAAQGVYTYGVEFLEDDGVNDFWGISFPSQA